jgi:glutamyl-tRNA reductase
VTVALVVLGLNHRTAPVALREGFAVSADRLVAINRQMKGSGDIAEAMVLSTCNRVEVYAVSDAPASDVGRAVSRVLGAERGLSFTDLRDNHYLLAGDEAIRHLLRVCASLDSLVVGEAQILGQVKEAAGVAREAGSVGPYLDRLLQTAFRAAKAVRTETGIAKTAVSIGSIAVDLAKRIFPKLDECRVLVIGAGKMGQVTARALTHHGVGKVYVTNRSYDKAVALAAEHGWRSRGFDELDDLLTTVDVVLTCTGASRPILGLDRIRRVVKRRKYRPLFIVDIAVPRDVDPAVSELDTVYLYNVDDLEEIGAENLERRREEAHEAEAIVNEALQAVVAWHRALRIQPTLGAIKRHADDIVEAELGKAFSKKLSTLDDPQRESVQKTVNAIVKKLLHPTMVTLRHTADSGEGAELAAAARRLHGIAPGDDTDA